MTQPSSRKPVVTPMSVLIGLMVLLCAIMTLSLVAGTTANARAQTAVDEAQQAQTDLSVHTARQNGSFESINSQLSTLRTYHSTLRSEMKEQRKLLDELLRKSGPQS